MAAENESTRPPSPSTASPPSTANPPSPTPPPNITPQSSELEGWHRAVAFYKRRARERSE